MTSVAPALTRAMPLEAGMRLNREEFHALYLAHPEVRKAELIDGVVYAPSPVSRFHAPQHALISAWLCAFTIGDEALQCADNGTVLFPGANEVQPDCALWREGGAAHYNHDGYLEGPPGLIAEITASSRQYDLGSKKELYRRSGVQEYLVWRTVDGAIDWWGLEGGEYIPIAAGRDGITESRVFPGLRLDVPRLLSGDRSRLLADIGPSAD
ncbi:MAG: Uma2 family endonuclease [Dehalococcoidia bacterium]